MNTNNHEIQSQWTTEGFMERFEQLVPQSQTYVEAYHKTEAEHQLRFGANRYASYDAFRMTRKKFVEKR